MDLAIKDVYCRSRGFLCDGYKLEKEPYYNQDCAEIEFVAEKYGKKCFRTENAILKTTRSFPHWSRLMPFGDYPAVNRFASTAHPYDANLLVSSDYHVFTRFIIFPKPSIESFDFLLRDSLFAKELWLCATNQQWTDIEFQVGHQIFAAHRALLTTRCPALLHPAQSSLMPIIIETIKPSVFEELLYFLYMRMMKNSSINKDLYEAATLYNVETIQRLFQLANV